MAELVIAGNKKTGRLVSVGQERYEGCCLVGGKMKRCTFSARNGEVAKEQYDKWRQNLLDEQAFMDMVERKEPEPEPEPELEPEPVTSDTNSPIYVIWAKGGNMRPYGAYRRMEDALAELDRLNEVAKFLGSESVFEVEEVAWR